MIRRFFRRLRKNERGAALVEFAIVAVLLITILLGIIEFGWVLHGVITLTGAAREGARLAVVNNYSAIQTTVENHASAWNVTSISGIEPGVPVGAVRTVSVTGDLNLLIGFFLGNPFTYTAQATMRQEGFVNTGGSNGSGSDPTVPSTPTSSWNGQHLDLSGVTNGATVSLYRADSSLINSTVAGGNFVRFDHIRSNYSGQTLSFKQNVNGVDSEYGYVTVP